ncbi:molybdopterin-dependent oxidoreductase [Variovorax sp. dw_954]|uniref:molybdopterin-dependent oxidoreductase n=1 Tax=Variovorax sp. dw_954 TaxID=2720078 RepID=UPI001BD37296|nr:molybdopterin-dependent oxidoreductase [Variovorax sp. dw_954]
MMIRLFRCATMLFALCALWSGAAAQVSMQVEVSGAVQRTLRLDATELATSEAQQIVTFVQTRSTQGVETKSTVRGVKLSALIERAGLVAKGRDGWKTLVIVATATDGYRAVFAWPEVTNTAGGDGVLLLFERDGKPLDEREGRIALMSTADRNLGARYVRNLARIEVRPLD